MTPEWTIVLAFVGGLLILSIPDIIREWRRK